MAWSRAIAVGDDQGVADMEDHTKNQKNRLLFQSWTTTSTQLIVVLLCFFILCSCFTFSAAIKEVKIAETQNMKMHLSLPISNSHADLASPFTSVTQNLNWIETNLVVTSIDSLEHYQHTSSNSMSRPVSCGWWGWIARLILMSFFLMVEGDSAGTPPEEDNPEEEKPGSSSNYKGKRKTRLLSELMKADELRTNIKHKQEEHDVQIVFRKRQESKKYVYDVKHDFTLEVAEAKLEQRSSSEKEKDVQIVLRERQESKRYVYDVKHDFNLEVAEAKSEQRSSSEKKENIVYELFKMDFKQKRREEKRDYSEKMAEEAWMAMSESGRIAYIYGSNHLISDPNFYD